MKKLTSLPSMSVLVHLNIIVSQFLVGFLSGVGERVGVVVVCLNCTLVGWSPFPFLFSF